MANLFYIIIVDLLLNLVLDVRAILLRALKRLYYIILEWSILKYGISVFGMLLPISVISYMLKIQIKLHFCPELVSLHYVIFVSMLCFFVAPFPSTQR